jgi:hypothetical protein
MQTTIRDAQLANDLGGWVPANETWTYASATTFTISGDKTDKYQKGDKIKLTQTTAKYFYIIGVSYSNPNTTVTVTGGSDYSLANASITNPFYSKIENPQGFPGWFNYSTTISGTTSMTWSTTTATGSAFCIKGKTCYFKFSHAGTVGGTVNPYLSCNVPVTAGSIEFNYAPVGVGDVYGDSGATNQTLLGVWNSTSKTQILIYKHGTANFSSGSGRGVNLRGFYSI